MGNKRFFGREILGKAQDHEKKKTYSFKEKKEEKRVEWKKEVKEIEIEKQVFFDESGVDSNIQNEYALAESYNRAYGKRSNGRRNRTGLLSGMGKDGLKAPFRFHGNVDGEVVERYFREHLVKELTPGQIVELDNASYHKRKG